MVGFASGNGWGMPDPMEPMHPDAEPAPPPSDDEDMIDKLRDMPVGTNDPNIVGDVGPTDIPPGSDPD